MKPTRVAAVAVLLLMVGGPPSQANCQLGGAACGDPAAIDCNNGVVCFIPWRTCSNCTCTTTSLGRTCLANALEPGSVSTLYVGRSTQTPGALDLTWSASCAGTGRDYAIEEGQLGSWYSHETAICGTGQATSMTFTPAAGDRYFLIAATYADYTGSLGTSSAGVERPPGDVFCTSERAIAPCP